MTLKTLLSISVHLLCMISISDSRHYDKLCSAIQNVTSNLNMAHEKFIFRCRPGDDCGGVGDRLGGVMGGALFSIMSGRSYRVHWPGLTAIFTAGPMNWTYDVNDLGLSSSDAMQLDATRIKVVHGGAFYNALFPSTSSSRSSSSSNDDNHQVAILNDLNAWLINNQTIWSEMKHYRTVLLHSNRGSRIEMYQAIEQQYHLPSRHDNNINADYYDGYRCIFHSMFQPSDEFLQSPYQNINEASAYRFSDIINILNDPTLFSIAFHYRVNDIDAETDSKGSVIREDTINWIIDLANKYKSQNAKNTDKINFFFITNSKSSGNKVMSHQGLKSAFHVIYSQQLSGDIHVNKHNGLIGMKHGIDENVVHSLRQAWRDWWAMMLSDVLICLMNYGFCKTAGLMAPIQQIKYETNHVVAPWWCGNRYC